MRLAHGGLESGVGLSGLKSAYVHPWSGPRPNSPFQKLRTTTATFDPVERSSKPFSKKPLCGNRQERNRERNYCDTGSRKHAASSARYSRLRVAAEGGSETSFANSLNK